MTIQGTRAQNLLRGDFYEIYREAVFRGGRDEEFPEASAVFTEEALQALRDHASEEALTTPILLTENLSNRVLAVHLTGGPGMRLIVVNTRFRVDPDVIAHTLMEEFAHAQQTLDNVDFAAQRREFAYNERPYEIEAKRIATEILGYDPAGYENYLRRDEPDGALYDRPR